MEDKEKKEEIGNKTNISYETCRPDLINKEKIVGE